MKLPGRSELPPDPHGRQITLDSSRAGTLDDGCNAYPERVAEAGRCWPEARASDFEQTGKRRFVDRATGRLYRRVPGAPLLAVGSEANRGISTWFVAGGTIVFLEPDGFPGSCLGLSAASTPSS